MVLQQKSEVKIRGKASPGKKIILHTGWDDKSYDASVSVDSIWKVSVLTPEASFNSNVTLAEGKEKIVLNDVFIGDVWLCSGQSNMHMPMKGYFGQPISGSLEDIVSLKNDHLRFLG